MGILWRTGKPVSQLVADRMPVTVELTLLSAGLTLVLGSLAGVISALYCGRLVDNLARLRSRFGLSIPVFWQGIMLILFFSLTFRWIPPMAKRNTEKLRVLFPIDVGMGQCGAGWKFWLTGTPLTGLLSTPDVPFLITLILP
jgi:ABC-type dipeptide/oligopeptide/nickel transport system permease component